MYSYPDPPPGHYFRLVERPWYDRDEAYLELRRPRRYLWDKRVWRTPLGIGRPELTRELITEAMDRIILDIVLDDYRAREIRDFNDDQRRTHRGD